MASDAVSSNERRYAEELERLDAAVRAERFTKVGGICRECRQLVANPCNNAEARTCPNLLR